MKSIACALLLFIMLTGGLPSISSEKTSKFVYYVTYTIENRGSETYFLVDDDYRVPLFQSNDWQQVKIVNATHEVILNEHNDVDGNNYAALVLPSEIPPNSSLFFSVTYEIIINKQPRPEITIGEAGELSDIPNQLIEEFCIRTKTFTKDETDIQVLANELGCNQSTVLGIVLQILDWFRENIQYYNYEYPHYPVNETLITKYGDCDDQAILFATICRALEIPAILQVGVVFSENINSEKSIWEGHLNFVQKGVGWHGWVLAYIPPWGWVPIDLTFVNAQDSISRILNAPQYEDYKDTYYIATCYNISNQDYIGDNRYALNQILNSDLYISISDIAIFETRNNKKSTLFVSLGVTVCVISLFVVFFWYQLKTFSQ